MDSKYLTSGAMYDDVPTRPWILLDSVTPTSAKPKSVILMWPLSCKRIFPGLMSLCTISLECRNCRPQIISAMKYLMGKEIYELASQMIADKLNPKMKLLPPIGVWMDGAQMKGLTMSLPFLSSQSPLNPEWSGHWSYLMVSSGNGANETKGSKRSPLLRHSMTKTRWVCINIRGKVYIIDMHDFIWWRNRQTHNLGKLDRETTLAAIAVLVLSDFSGDPMN